MTHCVPPPCPCCGRLSGVRVGGLRHPCPGCPFSPRVRLHSWGPYPCVLLSSTWGHAACKAPGRALVDEPSSQAQLSAVPEGGPTEENPPCPPLLPWELLESVWSGTPPPPRLAQLHGLDSGFVASAAVSQSEFRPEGPYEGEGSMLQWL